MARQQVSDNKCHTGRNSREIALIADWYRLDATAPATLSAAHVGTVAGDNNDSVSIEHLRIWLRYRQPTWANTLLTDD